MRDLIDEILDGQSSGDGSGVSRGAFPFERNASTYVNPEPALQNIDQMVPDEEDLTQYLEDVMAGKYVDQNVDMLGSVTNRLMSDDPEISRQAQQDFEGLLGFAGITKPAGKFISRAEQEAKGLYHPVGLGKKLDKPIEEMSSVKSDVGIMIPPQQINWEDMLGGRLITGTGDRTQAGKYLERVGENWLPEKQLLTGGNEFAQTHTPYGSVWASAEPNLKPIQRKALESLEAGKQPYLGFFPMGHGATNFNTMMSDAVLGQMQTGKLSKTAKQEFDRAMRKRRPDWKGIDSPEAMADLDNSGAMRHAFMQTMELKPFTAKRGFPDLNETRLAITDPKLIDTPLHQGGQSISKLSGELITDPLFPHPTYSAQLGGEYVGGTAEGIPRDVLMSGFNRARRASGADPRGDARSFDLSKPVQELDQQWLDNVMNYEMERDIVNEILGNI